MTLKNQIIDRVSLLIGDRSVRQASSDWGIPQATLQSMIKNRTDPKFDTLEIITKSEGVSTEWLISGGETSLLKIPQYDLQASAGNGCLVVSENPIAEFSFSQDWLIKQGLNNAKLCVVPVHGDSMEPTLIDEDLMLVRLIDDPRDGRDGICVIRIDDEIMVKRIQYDFTQNGYNVISDNTSYKPFFLGSEFKDRFSVIGRMVRVLQRAKI